MSPARTPRLAPGPAATNPTQTAQILIARETRKVRTVLTDKITRNIVPAVPMVVVPLADPRNSEGEYVERKRDPLERRSPITDYSTGPDLPTREVTPGKIAMLADELAVIRDERARGVEIARN